LNFLDRSSKYTQIQIFVKIRSVGAQLFHAERRKDERTDMTKLILAFLNFLNTSKNHRNPFCGYSLQVNPLNAELKPIFYLLALLGAHHFLHFSRI